MFPHGFCKDLGVKKCQKIFSKILCKPLSIIKNILSDFLFLLSFVDLKNYLNLSLDLTKLILLELIEQILEKFLWKLNWHKEHYYELVIFINKQVKHFTEIMHFYL